MPWIMFKEIYPQVDGSEIMLVVAGEDKNIRNCMDRVKQSGAIIHSIALGPNADPAVTEMSAVTGKIRPIHSRPSTAMHTCRG